MEHTFSGHIKIMQKTSDGVFIRMGLGPGQLGTVESGSLEGNLHGHVVDHILKNFDPGLDHKTMPPKIDADNFPPFKHRKIIIAIQ
ncbi:hypothetical protein J4464_03950 [Candidatus Woesearchaeota archaeon]|nr:hypothetical protein [Candidatus Woesearchaeota archaeon]